MRRLAQTLDAVRATRAKKAKVQALAALFGALDDDELKVAARLVLGELLPQGDPRKLGVGWAIMAAVAAQLTRRTEREVGLETRARGDFGDALAALLPDRPPELALRELPGLVDALAGTDDRARKHHLLALLLARCTPGEARYLGKALLGELRIGLQRGLFEEALAAAFGPSLDAVRAAGALTVDPGELAVLAKRGRLGEARVVVGSVVAFMLATPHEEVRAPLEVDQTVVEDKLDGVRTQAHRSAAGVRLFARGQGEVTAAFPEVVTALRELSREVILDGEIIAVGDDGRVRPFQALQARLGRTQVRRSVQASVPVRFVAYDCLYDEGPLLALPWAERRAHLERLPVTVNEVRRLRADLPLDGQLDDLFTAARARGHEGLMLKRIDAPYEAGKRGAAWRKVKKAFATLDVVITKAERGHGKRAGVLSDYTFAVWKGEQLVDIGKAYSGLTDEEIAALTQRLEALTVSRDGPFFVVEPRVVLEVAFDGLQPSPRHESGFALRFPRIVRVRDDKPAGEADRLETVTALFTALVGSGHREAAQRPPQLSLFDGEGGG